MKNNSNKASIALSTLFSIIPVTSFANAEWVDNIESKKIQMTNITPAAFDCYSYDNGYSRSQLLLNNILGVPSQTLLFERSELTSWGWKNEENDLQRCKLVDEIQNILRKNENKIDADLTIKTSSYKREYEDKKYGRVCNIDLIEEMKISFSNGLTYTDFHAPQGNITCAEYESIIDKSPKTNNLEISCTTSTNFVGRISEGYAKYYFGSNTFTLRPGQSFELAYASLGSFSHFYVPQVRVEVTKTAPFSVIYGVNTADWTAPEHWVLKTLDNPNGFEFNYRDSYPVFCKLQLQEAH